MYKLEVIQSNPLPSEITAHPNFTKQNYGIYKLTDKKGIETTYMAFSPGPSNVAKPIYKKDKNGNLLTYFYENFIFSSSVVGSNTFAEYDTRLQKVTSNLFSW